MMTTQTQMLLSMMQTLREATEELCNLTDMSAADALATDMDEFIGAIAKHMNDLAGEETGVARSLLQFQSLIKNKPREAALIEAHLSDTTAAASLWLIKTGLKAETIFTQYIDLLAEASKLGYCVLIAASDTPCGSPHFTPSVGAKFFSIGIRQNLSNKWRASYCAVTDGGKRIAEEISDTHSANINCTLGNNTVRIRSVGFGKADGPRSCSIWINDKQVAVGGIGLSIVVFDKHTGEILDSVSFNTYAGTIECSRAGDSEVIKAFKRNNPGVTFITPHFPSFPKSDLSENERWILENKIHHTVIRANPALPSAMRQYLTEPAGIVEVLTAPLSYIGTDGARRFEDHTGIYLNTRNGRRVTTAQPAHPQRAIFVLGGCVTLGIGVRDEGTFASQLQRLLNHHASEHGFIVENYAFTLNGTDEKKQLEQILTTLPVKPGDIVVGFGEGIFAYNPKFNERPYPYGEMFFDDAHLTETAHRLTAEGLYALLEQNGFFTDSLAKPSLSATIAATNYGFSSALLAQLTAYKQGLSDLVKREAPDAACIGAIVMNCNPFTLGHRYLIETCAKKVDYLLVFVVQEDKSYFPFADRMALVQAGVEDVPNVRVIESGKFIISTITFEDYFNKSELQDKAIDSSNDVTLFANEIAPAAHINIRFVGSEPLDTVTNQYNITLARILPQYGIQFEEIPRKADGGEIISASKVRSLLALKEWDAIRQLVPDVTYEYLRRNF